MSAPRIWTIVLPYPRPPLHANQRLHWRAHHRLRSEVTVAARWLIRAQRIGRLQRCSAALHYAPPDRRRRDADNLVPTLKVVCDALVLEGVVADDTPDLMHKPMPVIEEPANPARLWLVVTDLGPAT